MNWANPAVVDVIRYDYSRIFIDSVSPEMSHFYVCRYIYIYIALELLYYFAKKVRGEGWVVNQ